MVSMNDRYEPLEFEAKWRSRWKEADLFKTREEVGRPKFYGLDFFPYPSGAGLSVGHCRNYIPTDVLCRMKYMQGYNVLHPMGFDAFGLPAENEAIKRKSHPAPMIEAYAATYKRQMDLIGISYDWSRSFASCEPSYYKWTQWIFERLHEKGLAYRRMAAVNWDPIDQTVLADEEVIGGRAERSGALVEKKLIPQWFFRITEYAQRLIDDLDTVDWPEGIKNQQRNWIGRSEGVEFRMPIAEMDGSELQVFTTRIDTIFGMTFCVLAPEHPLAAKMIASGSEENRAAMEIYQLQARELSDIDRQATTRTKTGVFTGFHAINPANHQLVPIFLADYVLMGYGTGAIMAVPGHDARDFEFATKYELPIVQVISPSPDGAAVELPYEAKDGYLVNSAAYDGQSVADAQVALGEFVERQGIGKRRVLYKLRDWLISRQRYWGCPIPVIHTEDGREELAPLEDLPIELPRVESYEPSGDGTSPLAHIASFVNTTDSQGRPAKRETDTMGGFACSSWYFLRFADPHNDSAAWDPEKVNYWLPVDCYVGGAEHAVMHLLYARFWTKVLYDLGLVPFIEPFTKLKNQGQVLGNTPYRKARPDETLSVTEDGVLISFDEAKNMPEDEVTWRWVRMSKSKGNVVTPDEAAAQYGADALRIYELFVAPFDADVMWSNEGMQGATRFLSRVFKLASDVLPSYDPDWMTNIGETDGTAREIRKVSHQLIKKATADLERFAFNTTVAAMMTALNSFTDLRKSYAGTEAENLAWSEAIDTMVLVLAPMAPHSADEIWEGLGRTGFTYHRPWPTFDEALAAESVMTMAVQVNGKLRDTFEAAPGTPQEVLQEAALQLPKIIANLEGKTVRKVIVIPDRLVNIVAN